MCSTVRSTEPSSTKTISKSVPLKRDDFGLQRRHVIFFVINRHDD